MDDQKQANVEPSSKPAENIKHCEFCKKEHSDQVICPEQKEVLDRRAAFSDVETDDTANEVHLPEGYQIISTEELNKIKASERKGITLAETQTSSILDPNIYVQMKGIAKDFFESKAAPPSYVNMYQVLFALQAGHEMGMQPVESLQSITIINGVISVWGKAVPRALRRHGWKLKYEDGGEGDEQFCTATISNGDEEFTETISFKDAKDSGYTTDKSGKLKPGWLPGLNRRLKLRYDVLDVLCKTYVPEVFGSTAGTAEVLMDANITTDKVDAKADIEARIAEFKAKNGGSIVDSTSSPVPVASNEAGEPSHE